MSKTSKFHQNFDRNKLQFHENQINVLDRISKKKQGVQMKSKLQIRTLIWKPPYVRVNINSYSHIISVLCQFLVFPFKIEIQHRMSFLVVTQISMHRKRQHVIGTPFFTSSDQLNSAQVLQDWFW